ncbi:hypothetical protein ACOSQ3_019540 [Xanthoceras sorbifolium]
MPSSIVGSHVISVSCYILVAASIPSLPALQLFVDLQNSASSGASDLSTPTAGSSPPSTAPIKPHFSSLVPALAPLYPMVTWL